LAHGMRQALDEPAPYRIVHDGHDDGDRLRPATGCLTARGPPRHKDVDLQADQLSRELGVAIVVALSPASVDGDVLTVNVALLAQALAERFESGHSRLIGRGPR